VFPFDPSQLKQGTEKSCNDRRQWLGSTRAEIADPPHPLALLPARRNRPHRPPAPAPGGEHRAADPSIPPSARTGTLAGQARWGRTRRLAGTARWSAVAALRLITSSNLVGSRNGRSAGFAPFSTLPV